MILATWETQRHEMFDNIEEAEEFIKQHREFGLIISVTFRDIGEVIERLVLNPHCRKINPRVQTIKE